MHTDASNYDREQRKSESNLIGGWLRDRRPAATPPGSPLKPVPGLVSPGDQIQHHLVQVRAAAAAPC